MKYPKNRKSGKCNLSIDIGLSNLGYCVTDLNHSICYHNGSPMCGVRLMDAAQTAQETRKCRSTRHRLHRRRERIDLLQMLFAEQIKKVDESFFIRLNESALWEEDKTCGSKFSLFHEKSAEKQFYHKYPTIYHLFQDLIQNGTPDPRLLYLACHHLIKYRGHFLCKEHFSAGAQLQELLHNLNMSLLGVFPDANYAISLTKADEIEEIFKNNYASDDCYKSLITLLGIEKEQKIEDTLIQAICGKSFQLKTLFGAEFKNRRISLAKYTEGSIKEFLDDNEFELIQALWQLSGFCTRTRLLRGDTISRAMIKIYDKHGADLKLLKRIYKKYLTRDQERWMFKISQPIKIAKGQSQYCNEVIKNNYCAYVGINKNNAGQKLVVTRTTREAFMETLKKELEPLRDKCDQDERLKSIFKDIDDDVFLPKIVSVNNSVFPYQLNEIELNAILDTCSRFLPFLKNEDDDEQTLPEHKTVAGKIRSLLTYRVPYYVGPLNPAHKGKGGNAWVERLQSGKVTPWNFKQMVDERASAQGFMNNLIGKCSYLCDERVLPVKSLLYAKYNVLNQLNTLKVNGNRLKPQDKQHIFHHFFEKEQIVSVYKLKKFLVKSNMYQSVDEIEISGLANDKLNCSLSAQIQLQNIFQESFPEFEQIAEDIVYLHSVYTDKHMFKESFEEKHGSFLRTKFGSTRAGEILKAVMKLSFKEFGRLSREFLQNFKSIDKRTNKQMSIIDALYEYSECLNEILYSSNFSFQEKLKDYRDERAVDKIDYNYVDSLYVSPAAKRSIWQANLLVDELVHVLGQVPKKIFIEMTRNKNPKNKGKQTTKRKEQLKAYYAKAKKKAKKEKLVAFGVPVAKIIEEMSLELKSVTGAQLGNRQLYLYFLQLGRCAYSGKRIALEEMKGNKYDLDHIIPKSVYRDNSLVNLVLTTKQLNGEKGNFYPIPSTLRNSQNIDIWKMWRKLGLICDEKLSRLMRDTALTDNELRAFGNSQLVFTGQIAKEVARMFEIKYKGKCRIVYSKAARVSEFRNQFKLHKCREVNHLHHAHDAYLNIVVGDLFDTLYSDGIWQNNSHAPNPNNYEKVFSTKYVEKNGVCNENLKAVKENLALKFLPISKKVQENTGKMFHDSLEKNDNPNLIPRKEKGVLSDVTKYGGYNNGRITYFVFVESDGKNGTRELSIESVPYRFSNRIADSNEKLVELFESADYGLKNVKILYRKIRSYTLLQIGSSRVRVHGKSDEQIVVSNANEWYCSDFANSYVRTLSKYRRILSEESKSKESKSNKPTHRASDTIIVSSSERSHRVEAITPENNIKLYDEMTSQLSKKIYKDISNLRKQAQFLLNKRDEFLARTTQEQATVLLEILKLLQCDTQTSDLKLLGGAGNAGALTINKKLKQNVPIYVIEESISGLYQKMIPIKQS